VATDGNPAQLPANQAPCAPLLDATMVFVKHRTHVEWLRARERAKTH
jgi:hypothetical protein